MPAPYPQLLFVGSSIREEVNTITSKARDLILSASHASLQGKQADDIVQSLYTETEIVLPRLKRDEASLHQFEFYYAPYLSWIQNLDFGKLTDTRRGVIFAVDIPFSGNKKYFLSSPHGKTSLPPLAYLADDKITIYVPSEHWSVKQVQARFDEIIDNIEDHLNALADSLQNYPMKFRASVTEAIAFRRKALERVSEIATGLTFKPKPRAGAPDLSVPLVRTQIKPVQPGAKFTGTHPVEQQMRLEEATYQHILSVMHNMSLVMEYSPKAFETLGEEALRFHFLVQLNGQYEGTATGETFNGEGKSDILIRQENGNVFVAECKIWEGTVALLAAIDQLQRYVTWRDTKTAIVIFNRKKGFTEIIQKALDAVQAHPQYKSGPIAEGASRFRYVFANATDPGHEFILTLLLFNIPVAV